MNQAQIETKKVYAIFRGIKFHLPYREIERCNEEDIILLIKKTAVRLSRDFTLDDIDENNMRLKLIVHKINSNECMPVIGLNGINKGYLKTFLTRNNRVGSITITAEEAME